ncbi:MAG: hypothetical protein M0T86_01355, partial [Betaproteobacteria bacterium]|nr:hypothetical protein [Betaproteobacteria bacterium]
ALSKCGSCCFLSKLRQPELQSQPTSPQQMPTLIGRRFVKELLRLHRRLAPLQQDEVRIIPVEKRPSIVLLKKDQKTVTHHI